MAPSLGSSFHMCWQTSIQLSQRLSRGAEVGGIWEVAGLGLNPDFSIYTSLNLSFLILKIGAIKPTWENWDKIQDTETISWPLKSLQNAPQQILGERKQQVEVQPGETLAHFKSSHVETDTTWEAWCLHRALVPSLWQGSPSRRAGARFNPAATPAHLPGHHPLNPIRMAATAAQVLLRKPGYNQTGVSWGSCCRNDDHYYLQLMFTESWLCCSHYA